MKQIMKLNQWLSSTRQEVVYDGEVWGLEVRPPIRLNNGQRLSVQASKSHMCHPRNNVGPYTHVEVHYGGDPEWRKFGYEGMPDSDPFGFVPIELVEAYIDKIGLQP